MKRILSLIAIGTLGACAAAAQSAQTNASAQAGASTQTETTSRTSNSSTQISGNGAAATSSSASANAKAGNNSASLAEGTKIDAALATSLDAKRSKVGDEVEVRTEQDIKQDGKIVLKKGTHLVGHVTEAQARAKGQTESQLGVVFDHAVLKNGQQIPFSASIVAMASTQSAAAPSTGAGEMVDSGAGMSTMQGSTHSGSLVGGVASTANATAGTATGTVMNTASTSSVSAGGAMNAVTRSPGAVGGINSMGQLSSNSSGVFGMEGLSLNSAASNATQGSMIVSSTKNVHLDSGTKLLLRTNASAQ